MRACVLLGACKRSIGLHPSRLVVPPASRASYPHTSPAASKCARPRQQTHTMWCHTKRHACSSAHQRGLWSCFDFVAWRQLTGLTGHTGAAGPAACPSASKCGQLTEPPKDCLLFHLVKRRSRCGARGASRPCESCDVCLQIADMPDEAAGIMQEEKGKRAGRKAGPAGECMVSRVVQIRRHSQMAP